MGESKRSIYILKKICKLEFIEELCDSAHVCRYTIRDCCCCIVI